MKTLDSPEKELDLDELIEKLQNIRQQVGNLPVVVTGVYGSVGDILEVENEENIRVALCSDIMSG